MQLKYFGSKPPRQAARGFTLIEIIVTVMIVAILAAIAIPAYTAYLARGYRSEARATLTAAAQWMERWRTERGTYQDGGNPPALPAGLNRSPPTGGQRYNITVATPNAGTYTVSAAPMGSFAGDACGTLTLDNTGGTDHLAFHGVGVPGFQFIQDPVSYSTRTHHSNMDNWDHAIGDDLAQAATIMASFAWHAAQRDEMLPRKRMQVIEPVPASSTR